MLTLFVDSDSDFDLESAKVINAKIISMPYRIGETEYWPYESWDKFDADPYYNSLRSGVIPKTSGLSPAKYISYFEPEFEKGNDILYIHFTKAMSMTFDSMHLALESLKEKYPDRKFYEIDTNAITVLSFVIARELAQMINSGKSVEEVIEYAKKETNHYAMYFFADDLKFFAASGRVSGITAKMGSFLNVKPIIYIGEDGKMTSIGKVMGKLKAIQTLLSKMEQFGDDVKNHPIVIGHTGWEKGALQLKEAIQKKYGADTNVEIVMVNPTAGAHAGPDGVGVVFHSLHR